MLSDDEINHIAALLPGHLVYLGDGVIEAVVEELAKVGVITGVAYQECERVDAGEQHGAHAHVDSDFGPLICDGYEPDKEKRT